MTRSLGPLIFRASGLRQRVLLFPFFFCSSLLLYHRLDFCGRWNKSIIYTPDFHQPLINNPFTYPLDLHLLSCTTIFAIALQFFFFFNFSLQITLLLIIAKIKKKNPFVFFKEKISTWWLWVDDRSYIKDHCSVVLCCLFLGTRVNNA